MTGADLGRKSAEYSAVFVEMSRYACLVLRQQLFIGPGRRTIAVRRGQLV